MGNLTCLSGVVILNTPKSLLFFDDDTGLEVFIPKSQVKDWFFKGKLDRFSLTVDDLHYGDEINITIPKWLARKEGLSA